MGSKKAKIKEREQAIFNFKVAVIEAFDAGATVEELSKALDTLNKDMLPDPIVIEPPKIEVPVKKILTFGEDEKPTFSSFFITNEGPSPNETLNNITIRLFNILGKYNFHENKNAGQILSMPKETILELKGMGSGSYKELKAALIEKGYQRYCPETHWIHEKD